VDGRRGAEPGVGAFEGGPGGRVDVDAETVGAIWGPVAAKEGELVRVGQDRRGPAGQGPGAAVGPVDDREPLPVGRLPRTVVAGRPGGRVGGPGRQVEAPAGGVHRVWIVTSGLDEHVPVGVVQSSVGPSGERGADLVDAVAPSQVFVTEAVGWARGDRRAAGARRRPERRRRRSRSPRPGVVRGTRPG
jgi:hypothetical protein